jgi:hypothetical protein
MTDDPGDLDRLRRHAAALDATRQVDERREAVAAIAAHASRLDAALRELKRPRPKPRAPAPAPAPVRRRRVVAEPAMTPAVENGAATEGRDPRSGKFTAGNKAARNRRPRGDCLRRALHAAVSEQDVAAVAKALVTRAARGDHRAASVVLGYLLGRPRLQDAEPLVLESLPDEVKSTRAAVEVISALWGEVTGGRLSTDVARRAVQVLAPLLIRQPDGAVDDWNSDEGLDGSFL